MSVRTRPGGDLHGKTRAQIAIGGFIVTEGTYEPASVMARHDHEFASICIVLAGGYDESFGRGSRRGEPGVVIVHPDGERHEEINDRVPTQLLTVEIGTMTLQALRPALRIFDDAWHRKDFAIAGRAFGLCAEISRQDSASPLILESSILDILGALDRSRLGTTRSAPWLLRVRDCLEANFDNALTMNQLSDIAGVHPVHLARAFRSQFGCSVGTYVRRLQVGKAALMLQQQDRPLAAVAHESGFSDQSHMTRLVSAYTGFTPGVWRRRSRSHAFDS